MENVHYQISTTFFDGYIEIEDENIKVSNFQRANEILKHIERDYIFYDNDFLWEKDRIFSVRILMTINKETRFDRTINIAQLKILNDWDKIEVRKQEKDEFTQKKLSKIQNRLESQFQQLCDLTIDDFLANKKSYLTSNFNY